ncbi:TIGR01777 family oxidoreductase [Rhodohalobacter halophilus]|uniref:TIGR01777 family oxidoreductase n=1 Tax=Rhodohalobacter halophilus TaxID=1812810 RepID=UPI00083F5D33|nr:TIGR01777 family oxidoreductase [Rhodohalobacter halophilus]
MEEKRILITGGTGFVGRYLREELLKQGNYLTIVTRSPKAYKSEHTKNQKFITLDEVPDVMESTDVVINLAGENLFGQRWTESVKKKIYDSRISITRELVDAIRASSKKPDVFISASGINYYKPAGDDVITEGSKAADDFLAKVCKDWEKEAVNARELGVRVVISRFGIVLEEDGGVIEKMKLPFSLFVGGAIGPGTQYLSWIHMKDLCNAIVFAIENEEIDEVFNATAPEPVTMNEFASAMGRVMNRPSFFRVPEFALNIALGEAAVPVVSSLNVQPKVLQKAGFNFQFEDVETALGDIL